MEILTACRMRVGVAHVGHGSHMHEGICVLCDNDERHRVVSPSNRTGYTSHMSLHKARYGFSTPLTTHRTTEKVSERLGVVRTW